jgi:HEAT repeat protein
MTAAINKQLGILLAILFLGLTLQSASAKTVAELIADLNSTDRRTRQDAVRELRESRYSNNSQIIEPLLNVLRTDSSSLNREYAAEALLKNRNAEVFTTLTEIAGQTADGDAHSAVIRAFANSESSRVKAPLLQALSSPHRDARRSAARGLDHFVSDTQVQTALVSSLNTDADELTRDYAAASISRLPRTTAANLLIRSLDDSSSLGRESAAYELGRLGDARAVPSLISVIGNSNRDLRRKSIRALNDFASREEVVTALLGQFADETDNTTKGYIVDSLSESRDRRIVPIMISVIESTSFGNYEKSQAAQALKNVGDKSALVALAALLGSNREGLRTDAYEAIRAILGRMPRTQEVNQALACLPGTTSREHSDGTKSAAILLDLMIPVLFGSFSIAAHQDIRVVNQLTSAQVAELQHLFESLQ